MGLGDLIKSAGGLNPITAAADTIINPVLTAITNRQNRKHALEDWDRQNAYNHPAQQMQRLKEAGLNPNLVYGNGATTLAAPVRPNQAQVPEVNLQKMPQMLGQFNNLTTQKLEQDKTQTAIDLMKTQKENTAANTLSTLAGIPSKESDAMSKRIYNEYAPEYFKQRNEGMKVRTGIAQDQNAMQLMSFPVKMDKLLADLANVKAKTGLIPTQKAQMEQNISALTQKMHYYGLSESQKIETGKILQESALLKNAIQGKQIKGQELQNELLKIKAEFKRLGLSETATSDIIKQSLSIIDFF